MLQPGGEQVTSSDAQPALDPASTSANPLSLPDADQPEVPEQPQVRRRGGPKKYICHIYGVVKPRKPDLTVHLWYAHKQGDPIVCDRPPCTGQSFSTRASLKKHIESQHKKKWPYKCKDCYYGTRAKAYYVEHCITNMVPGWSTVRPRSHWIILAKNARRFARAQPPFKDILRGTNACCRKSFSAHSA